MTDIYLHFIFAHGRLSVHAPVDKLLHIDHRLGASGTCAAQDGAAVGRRPRTVSIDRTSSQQKENGSSKVTHEGGCTLLGDAKAGVPEVPEVGDVRVRFQTIGNARIENVGKYQSCMVSKLPIIWKQTVLAESGLACKSASPKACPRTILSIRRILSTSEEGSPS